MGFFKCLAYIAGGVGAVVLAPMTGGSSIALAIGAMGTTTAAGVAIGAGIGATAAAIDYAISEKNDAHARGVAEGLAEGEKVGERIAQQKYESKVTELIKRFSSYHDFNSKLIGMYAIGLATANADGKIYKEERQELDEFVSGCMASHLPAHIKDTIASLEANPPTLERAIEFARNARLPKHDIDDIIDIIVNADGFVCQEESTFIYHWQQMSHQYEFA